MSRQDYELPTSEYGTGVIGVPGCFEVLLAGEQSLGAAPGQNKMCEQVVHLLLLS